MDILFVRLRSGNSGEDLVFATNTAAFGGVCIDKAVKDYLIFAALY